MSVVRISEKLILSVGDRVTYIYKQKKDEVAKQKPNVGDALFDLIHEPYIDTMKQLPDCFFRNYNEVTINGIEDTECILSFRLSSTRLGSLGFPSSEHLSAERYSDKVNIKRTHRTEEIIDAIQRWRAEMELVSTQRDGSITAIRSLLRKHKSLPPAIKDFPPLVELLPTKTKNKTSVPQHRLSSVTMELNPALKQLAADIAIEKFFKT